MVCWYIIFSLCSTSPAPTTFVQRFFHLIGLKNNICRKFSLRVHKFSFQWDLVLHLSVCVCALSPFLFTGDRSFGIIPISVWIFYHVLFWLGPRQANLVVPGFGKFKHSFKTNLEEFFSPKLLPVLSISYLLVALSLAVTGHRLGGTPLCFSTCDVCLSSWQNSVRLDDPTAKEFDSYRTGCGFANGKEMLAFYTMAQTSFLLFFTVVVAMAVCLAWRIADEENIERTEAEDWLKRDCPAAYELRSELIRSFGSPASAIRPEGGPIWVFFGVIAAVSFTLLGWHHWYVLPPSPTATLLIILNLFTILTSMLILHLGFFGRILAIYKRNYLRVQFFTTQLMFTSTMTITASTYGNDTTANGTGNSPGTGGKSTVSLQAGPADGTIGGSGGTGHNNDLDIWWNCRNFVLNDDLSLDYDIGGLAVSATFMMNVFVFIILMTQIFRKDPNTNGYVGHMAMLEPPGSYCAYGCMYITTCLIKIFTIATHTYEEQHRHIIELQHLSASLLNTKQIAMGGTAGGGGGTTGGGIVLGGGSPFLSSSSLYNLNGQNGNITTNSSHLALAPPSGLESKNSGTMNIGLGLSRSQSGDDYDIDGPIFMDSPIGRHHLRPSNSFSNGSNLIQQPQGKDMNSFNAPNQSLLLGGGNSPPRTNSLNNNGNSFFPPLPLIGSAIGANSSFYGGNVNTGIAMTNRIATDATDDDNVPLLSSSAILPPPSALSAGKKKQQQQISQGGQSLSIAAVFDEEVPVPRVSPKSGSSVPPTPIQESGFFESLMQKSFYSKQQLDKQGSSSAPPTSSKAMLTTATSASIAAAFDEDDEEMDYVDFTPEMGLDDDEESRYRLSEKGRDILTPLMSLERLPAVPSIGMIPSVGMDMTSGDGVAANGSTTPFSYNRHNAVLIENTRLMIAELVSQIR